MDQPGLLPSAHGGRQLRPSELPLSCAAPAARSRHSRRDRFNGSTTTFSWLMRSCVGDGTVRSAMSMHHGCAWLHERADLAEPSGDRLQRRAQSHRRHRQRAVRAADRTCARALRNCASRRTRRRRARVAQVRCALPRWRHRRRDQPPPVRRSRPVRQRDAWARLGGPHCGSAELGTASTRAMRRSEFLATAALCLCVALFAAARILQPRWPWLGFVAAFAEAATIGGLADWYAVVALFQAAARPADPAHCDHSGQPEPHCR